MQIEYGGQSVNPFRCPFCGSTNDRANQIINAFDTIPAVEAEPLEPNNPLTLEQLREMDGEPIFVIYTNGARSWHIVKEIMKYANYNRIFWKDGGTELVEDYGVTWLAYRRKPEEREGYGD